MLQIRHFEHEVAKAFLAGRIPGFLHSSVGQEAVAVGVCSALREDDYVVSTHRGHGHVLAKGADLKAMMAEIYGKVTGCCKGKGGSMHIADFDRGIVGANGIVGGGIPIANGVALAAKKRKNGQVVACFFGDGASNQGTFHEALNLASIWDLPVVFVAENNMYGMGTSQRRHQKVENIADRAAAYKIPGAVVDGNDVLAVREATLAACDRARRGEGPTLLECKTYRHYGHFVGDPGLYREPGELEAWMERDPLILFRRYLEKQGVPAAALDELEAQVIEEVREAVDFAHRSDEPAEETALEDVYAPTEAGRRAIW
ncbi:MAG: thiamine pyrophosphate-dependent dehydrogenase E1 component subunit alpha [Firmicutes bacterium]|nr:thiamine pyrophosphate-dependent dehydrogenase E1 component subunit alpha [Bacillota bacterium]